MQLGVLTALPLPREWLLGANFLAAVVGAAVFYGLNVVIAAGVLSLRTNQAFRSVISGDLRETVYNSLALAPLGWLMSIVYSLAWWATLLFALAAATHAHGLAAVRRDARHVHADDRRAWLRRSTSGIRSRRGTASGSRRSRSTSGG